MKFKKVIDYKRKRKLAYPPIEDQLDAIWKVFDIVLTDAKKKQLDEDTINILNKIKQIKLRYLKESK